MTSGKSILEHAETGTGQFSKFSINQDRPAKRRRNLGQAELGPTPSGGSAGSGTAGASQAESDAGKPKDGTVQQAARSCAECRRMKLKCDRIFPCKTCVRRGLEGICPEGSLVTGRGTRYVLASTQELHEKILKMADRIKTLEDALAALHQEHSNCRPCTCHSNQKGVQSGPHPLLCSDLLLIKGQLELYGLGSSKDQSSSPPEQPSHPEFSSPSRDLEGALSPREDSFRKGVLPSEAHRDEKTTKTTESKRMHSEAEERQRASREPTEGRRQRQLEESPVERGERLRAMLPPPEEAEHLAREAIWHGAWILNVASRPAKRAKLLHDLYHGPLEDIRAQDVALTLMGLALGERVNIGPTNSEVRESRDCTNGLHSPASSSPLGDDESNADVRNIESGRETREQGKERGPQGTGKRCSRSAQESYNLAKMALNEASVEGEPDQTVVHCLFIMAWYLSALADSKDAGRDAMAAVGLAVRIAFKIGMHLEETYAGLPVEAQQDRRILFWALLHLEAKLHLDASTGTIGALGRKEITAKRPSAVKVGALRSFPTQTEAIYHDFKLAFLENCVVPTLEIVEGAPKLRLKEHDYYRVLDVDARIRDFEVPTVLAEPISEPPPPDSHEFLPVGSHADLNFILNPSTSVSSFSMSYTEGQTPRNVLRMIRLKAQQEKLITLLYLHRTFFYAHIRDHRPLVQRMFLPSCLAAFSAACELIRSVREVYSAEPELSVRVSMLWYNAFLATITLFLLVVYKPFCPVTIIALQEMEKSRNLFQQASAKCHMAAQSYPLLHELYAKANAVYNRWKEESEGEMNVFGPNGEVTFCQTRLDIVIQRLQCVSVPSPAEEDATAGLLNLKRCTDSPCVQRGKPCEKVSQSSCSTGKVDDGPSYEIWQHVHKELTDFVRRVPEVLRDAAIDPRRATAARLIWGFIPLPDEPTSEDVLPFDETGMGTGLPSDLDWNAFADALMFARPDDLFGPSVSLGLPTPPPTTCSPESAQSTFSMFDLCPDFDAGRTGLTPDINMDNVWNVPSQHDDLIGLPGSYADSPFGLLRNDPMLGIGGGDHAYLLHKGDGEVQDTIHAANEFSCNDFLSSNLGDLEDGTLGYLWQHRIRSPYL